MESKRLVHQFAVALPNEETPICGRVWLPLSQRMKTSESGYWSIPESVTCAACCRKLFEGYWETVRDYWSHYTTVIKALTDEQRGWAIEAGWEPPAAVTEVTGDDLLQVTGDQPVIDTVAIHAASEIPAAVQPAKPTLPWVHFNWPAQFNVPACWGRLALGETLTVFGSDVTCPACRNWLNGRHIPSGVASADAAPADAALASPPAEICTAPEVPFPSRIPAVLSPEVPFPPVQPLALPKALDEVTLMRIGAEFPQIDGHANKAEIDRHLEAQRQEYLRYDRVDLVAELIRRDKNAILKGQEIAEGKVTGRLLREFVRGILYTADKADLVGIERGLRNGAQIDRILGLLGAESASARDLRLNGGTTLGDIRPGSLTPIEDRIERPAGAPITPSTQLSSPAAAEAVREQEAKVKPAPIMGGTPPEGQTSATRNDDDIPF